MTRPLEGIRVVELGTHVAVPLGSRQMADWGAEVIKVEPPMGEAYRRMGATFDLPYEEDFNVIFQPMNVAKKSISIDLKKPEGLKVLMKLLESADVFTTNTRLKSLKKMGIDYDSLKEKFPRLIYAQFSGFGSVGPDSERPGFDVASFWARGGALLEWSYKDTRPFAPFHGFGDSVSSQILLTGILSAIISREKTGKGDLVEGSLLNSTLWVNSHGVVRGQPECNKTFPRRAYDQEFPSNVPYKSSDGKWFLVIDAYWDKLGLKLFSFLGLEELLDDPRFKTLKGYNEHTVDLIPILDEAFTTKTYEEIDNFLTINDIVHERLRNPNELYKDEQAWANGYLREIDFPSGKKLVIPKSAVKFRSMEEPAYHIAPNIGADSMDILKDLGYTSEEAKHLIDEKAVVQDRSNVLV